VPALGLLVTFYTGALSLIRSNILDFLSSFYSCYKVILALNSFIVSVCINLIIQLSHIPGHEIRIVSYALWDGGDCLLY